MTKPILQQGTGFHVGLMMPPEENIAMPVVFDFSIDTTLTKDFTQELAALKIPFIQCVFIDNSADANSLTLTLNGDTGQTILVKGNTQGYYPLAWGSGPKQITVTTGGGNAKKTLIFLSMIVPPIQWTTA